MRTANQLPVVQEVNANFPFGSTIQNETTTQEGTPVVRELIGDILQNMYKLLDLTNITPNGEEDSNAAEYQIVEALKKLPNSTNDIERVLDLDALVWTVDLNFTILPNKYFFFARAAENYDSSVEYTIKGTTEEEYPFKSFGFKTGEPLLVIIDQSEVRCYSLLASTEIEEVAVSLGNPLSFMEGSKLWYEVDGSLMSDEPSVNNIQSVLQGELMDVSLVLNDMFVIKGSLLCFCFIPSGNQYFFRKFDLNDLTISESVSIVGTEFGDTDDFFPYVFAYKSEIYITNDLNTTSNDYGFSKFSYNSVTPSLTFVSSFDLDNSFGKTTNAAIKNNLLYTMIYGNLNSFDLTSGDKVFLGNYPGILGQLFGLNDSIYYNSGEVAKKWF